MLLPSSGHDAEHPLDKTAARFAVGSAATLAPQHGMTKHALGGVVRRLDPCNPDEGPQRRFLPSTHSYRGPSFRVGSAVIAGVVNIPAISHAVIQNNTLLNRIAPAIITAK